MKRIALAALWFSSTLMATELSEEQAKQLLQNKNYSELLTKIDDMSHHDLVSYKVRALQRQENFDDAVDLLEKRISTKPNNIEWQARNHFMKGQVHANQAIDASIFTASGYAEDSLNSFTKAHELLPNDMEMAAGILGFLTGAPSFVGGDPKKALSIATRLEESHPLKAGVWVVRSYKGMDETEQAEAKLVNMMDSFPQNHQLALQAVHHYSSEEKFDETQQILDDALTWNKPEDEKDMAHFHRLNYAYVKNSIELKSKANLEKALAAIQSFQKAPDNIVSDYEQWPILREAQIRLLMGQKKQAIALAKQARAASDDSKLRKKAKRIIKKGRI